MFALLLIVSGCMELMAQTTREEMYANLDKMGSVHYAYPVTESLNTKAPKGYTPFHISHYGRHGSRFLTSYEYYGAVYQILLAAQQENALTAQGNELLKRMDEICAEAKDSHGELTPLGRMQHRGIAERMYKAFPEVFKNRDSISARSTMAHRCGMSMAAFGDRLKELNPKLNIYYQMERRFYDYLLHSTPEGKNFGSMQTGPWVEEYRKFKSEHIRTARLMDVLFSKSDFVRKRVHPENFVWNLYLITSDLQDMQTQVRLYDFFEKEELFDLWQCQNYQLYSEAANNPLGKGAVPSNAKHLLRNIVESADEALGESNIAATLRFGHDTGIMPLVALIELNNFAAEAPSIEETYKYWCDWKASPMAANIQFVFFNKKNGAIDDVLVKILYNERESRLPVATDNFPFYKWTDVREYFVGKYQK